MSSREDNSVFYIEKFSIKWYITFESVLLIRCKSNSLTTKSFCDRRIAVKSIKPGRGPSMMSGVVGVLMISFGVLWTAFAFSFSPIIALFGVLWTGVAITITVYNFKNATGKNRYSQFDITDSNEEPDPLNERFGNAQSFENSARNTASGSAYCPYCGTPVGDGFEFCNRCCIGDVEV